MFEPEWLLRLLAALAAGIGIGVERQNRAKEAGLRTHATVALASCLLVLISKYGFRDIAQGDPGRVAASVVTGVGFLGAGVIFVRHDVVQGLTTAAGIWATSAIGMCFGSGMYVIGLISTLLMYIVQHVLYRYFPHNYVNTVLKFKIRMRHDNSLSEVLDILDDNHLHPLGENRIISDGEGGWYLFIEALTHKAALPEKVIGELERSDKIIAVELI